MQSLVHETAVQAELPFAIVQGEPLSLPPSDLYIPPDALEVILEAFEGPLDLLLYLIKRQNLDILDIPIAEITLQYVSYIELMDAMRLELAAEYLVMAALLAEIKSKMLLPRPESSNEEEDPRAELVRRLQEYEQIRQAAAQLDELPRLERDINLAHVALPALEVLRPEPEVDLGDLMAVLRDLLKRSEMFGQHQIRRERLSVRERMVSIMERLDSAEHYTELTALFIVTEGRLGIVVTFLAVLELQKERTIDVVQNERYAPIYVKLAS
ncbi:MAG: segregation and condensation protein A [Thiotrichales bacterium]